MQQNPKIQGRLRESTDQQDLQEKVEQCLEFFRRKGWIVAESDRPGQPFLAKRRHIASLAELPPHLGLSKKKGYKNKEALVATLQSFFEKNGYKNTASAPIVNDSKTLFTVAGVQKLNDVFFDEQPFTSDRLFINQPVIRLNTPEISGTKGLSTSFVNSCTLKVEATLEEHLEMLDCWLSFLSSQGLFVGDMILRFRADTPDWGTGRFKNLIIDVNYGDLQLGDAVLIYDFPQKTRPSLTVSDIGFGLERIGWAINKTPSYFDWIGPIRYSVRNEIDLMDTSRTLALMAMGGVEPSNNNQGYHFRKLVKQMVARGNVDAANQLIDYYGKYWRQFYGDAAGQEEIFSMIHGEFQRAFSRKILATLNLSQLQTDNPDKLLELLLENGIEFSKIEQLLKT